MLFQAGDRLYVDESKARGYHVVATAAGPGSIRASEKALRSLLKPGQRRLHFTSERDSRRRLIVSRMCELEVRVAVWSAKGLPDKVAPPLCLASLTKEALLSRASHLIIERDDSLMRADRRLIADVVRKAPATGLRYDHAAPHTHPLLWVSDAVAWCFSHGGDWQRRAAPMVETRTVHLTRHA